MYVCMYVCVYVYIHICIFFQPRKFKECIGSKVVSSIGVGVSSLISVYLDPLVCMHSSMYAYTHACIHVYIYIW